MAFTPFDRPVRAAFVGLGRIYDLNVRAYRDNDDVEVVALVDPSEERRACFLELGAAVGMRRPGEQRDEEGRDATSEPSGCSHRQ